MGEVQLPKVALICNERFPIHSTSTNQVIKNAQALHAVGLPIDLIIPWQQQEVFDQNYHLKQEIYKYYNIPNGLGIKVLKTLPANKIRWEKFSNAIAGLIYAKYKEYDLIYTRNKFTALLALLTRMSFIFETYRLLGDDFPVVMRLLARFSKKSRLKGIILHSKLAEKSFLRSGFPPEKLTTIHNGFDLRDISPVLSRKEARALLRLDSTKPLIVYAGNMQKNKSVDSLIDLAARTPEYGFMLVGGTSKDLNQLKKYAAEKRVENVSFLGHKPVSKVSMYLYAADILIMPMVSKPLEGGKTVLPFKTFLYLAVGRPILAPQQDDLSEILKDRENAILVPPDDIEQATLAVREIIGDKELQQKLSTNALRDSKEMTWEKRAGKIIQWIRGL